MDWLANDGVDVNCIIKAYQPVRDNHTTLKGKRPMPSDKGRELIITWYDTFAQWPKGGRVGANPLPKMHSPRRSHSLHKSPIIDERTGCVLFQETMGLSFRLPQCSGNCANRAYRDTMLLAFYGALGFVYLLHSFHSAVMRATDSNRAFCKYSAWSFDMF